LIEDKISRRILIFISMQKNVSYSVSFGGGMYSHDNTVSKSQKCI
jgi:hypothetical protein